MAAEPRDCLMTLEQWLLMRKNNEKDDRKELDIEEIDQSDIPKATVLTVTESKEGESSGEPEDKECSIF